MFLKTIAKKHSVPRTTLRRLWLNDNYEKPTLGRRTILTRSQEQSLADLIIERQERAFPMTVDIARQLVFEFCEKNQINHNFNKNLRRAGWNWWSGFRKRNPHIVLRQPENISRNRALGMEEDRIKNIFDASSIFWSQKD